MHALEPSHIAQAPNMNLHQSLVTVHRVPYFVLQAHMGTCTSHTCVKEVERGLRKMKLDRPRRQLIRKGEVPGSRQSMHGCILTYVRL